jgi:hypothetical protein
MGLIYVLICAVNYPQRCAHSCLEELQRTVRGYYVYVHTSLISISVVLSVYICILYRVYIRKVA